MSSKITLLVYLTCFFAVGCKENNNQNYFSGTIEYAYSYGSDSLNIDSLTNARFSKGIFRYDTANYQSHFIGADTATYYYSGKLNKSIYKIDSAKYECEDYGIANDSVLSFRLYDTDEEILGYRCRILELQKKNSWVKYYVSTGHKIAPATYRKHRSYNWDLYGEKANGGLILKMEHRLKIFTLFGVATLLNQETGNFKALEIDESELEQACTSKN